MMTSAPPETMPNPTLLAKRMLFRRRVSAPIIPQTPHFNLIHYGKLTNRTAFLTSLTKSGLGPVGGKAFRYPRLPVNGSSSEARRILI